MVYLLSNSKNSKNRWGCNVAREKVVNLPECVLKVIPLSDIEEGTRFREDYGDLGDLKFSIETQGLINPIAVMAQEGAAKPYVLVAGGRRFRACTELGVAEVPVRIFTRFDELQLRLLELAENLQRKEMTWQEQNRLQREIHALQQQVHGAATPYNQNGWRLEDTAQMLGVSKATIHESIKLGEKLEKYSEILGDASKFKTENDARKAIKTVEEAMIRSELARRAEKRQSSDSFTQQMADRYIIGDCLEKMESLSDESFDFAEVDPPYGINLEYVKREGNCEQYQEVEQEDYLIFSERLLRLIYAKLKPNTFCILWFGIDPWLEYLYKVATKVGFTGNRIPLIWTKANGQSMNPSYSLANAYEAAFVLKKGSPVLAKPGRINIFDYRPVAPIKKFHPTQKPLPLYQDIYATFSLENAKCLVPFAGSGASLIAAMLEKRQAIGFDLSEEFKGGYLQLVSETFLQGE